MISKGLSVFLALGTIAVTCSGCGSANRVTSHDKGVQFQSANLNDDYEEPQPEILLLSGTISYDSLKAAYGMAVKTQRRVNGFLNLENGNIGESDANGLNYVQLAQDSTVLGIRKMDNPLVQQMEYHDGDILGRKTVRLKEADFYLRIQLDPLANKILFRNGSVAIMTLDVNE